NLISAPNELIEMLDRALVEDPPFALKEGGIFRSGYNSELDSFRNTKIKGKDWLLELELKEREKTGISSLKIKSNNIIGYFIEVTKANLKKVPESYLRKQQTTNSERFITEELKQLETSILTAESKLVELEQGLFRELREELKAHTKTLRSVAQAVAELDLYQTFAEIAERDNLIKPQLNSSIDLKIKAGRHPIIAKTLEHEFIPNDIELSLSNPLSLLVTGPNMGGKSTFLRQNALIVIMSQLGSFVPAASASLGLVDKVFARLGAADDLTEGESTFMVEMRETSFILANATEKSLILIDEIGRGTATRDGLAIARSVLEWVIEKIKCRSLFATHFHELTELDKTYASLENISVKSLEQGTKVVFTHEMVRGAANNSYGIEVADLAGLPRLLIKRSRKILKSIVSVSNTNEINQLEMFDSNHGAFESEEELPQTKEELLEIEQDLKNIDPSQMTPIEALLMLDKLQKKLIGS
ncbi:MAG: DNA mismatch repair protein MutS, partial [Bdellovibrionales bacterium]|nr:DNA mismatch repair protein MutS [Bdellovibrionales bacterium]